MAFSARGLTLLLVPLAVLLIGCHDATGPGTHGGVFSATQVNGLDLPALVYPSVRPSGYTGPTLTLFSGTLVLSERDSLMLVIQVGSSPDTLRAQYTMRGDTLNVAADTQRSHYSRIVGPVIRQPSGKITVPAAQYLSLSSGFTTISLNLTFATP